MKQVSVLLWIAFTLAVARVGWVWLARHDAHERMESSSRAGQERAYVASENSGSGVEITQFYARDAEIVEDDSDVVCYGVRNARSVRLEPPVESLTPAFNRCFSVEPREDTTYTLTAEGTDGTRASASFRVHVKPAAPAFLMFSTSEKKIPPGEAVTMCYRVAHARSLRMEPNGWQLPTTQNCVRFYPRATGTYALVASGDGGTCRQEFGVVVQK